MRSRFLSAATLAGVMIYAAPAAAQVAPPPDEQSSLGLTTTVDTLRDLPLGENVYAVLETTQPEVIADRFNSAGLNTGQSPRVGAFLASSSQTVFRIGDVD